MYYIIQNISNFIIFIFIYIHQTVLILDSCVHVWYGFFRKQAKSENLSLTHSTDIHCIASLQTFRSSLVLNVQWETLENIPNTYSVMFSESIYCWLLYQFTSSRVKGFWCTMLLKKPLRYCPIQEPELCLNFTMVKIMCMFLDWWSHID